MLSGRRRVAGIIGLDGTGLIRQSASMLMFATVIGGTWNAISPTGLLARPNAGDILVRGSRASLLPTLSANQVRSAIQRNPAICIVDARDEESFNHGGISGAINIPMVLGISEMRRTLEPVKYDAEVIVYCQSPACTFAKAVARKLLIMGYTRVEIMPGGWREWSK